MEKSTFTPEHEHLCALLRTLRVEAGLTQVELAESLDEHQSFVSKCETGERRLDLVELREVCRALGVPLGEFVRRFEKGAR